MKLKTNINPNYKTKKCIQFYENGYCPYGIRCQFLHKEQFSSTDNPTEGLSSSEIIGNNNSNINKDNNTYSSSNVTINNELSNKLSIGSVPNNNVKYFHSPQTLFVGISQVSKELSYQKLMQKLMNSYSEDTEVVDIKDHKKSEDDYSSR
jgi:hypothetical protein